TSAATTGGCVVSVGDCEAAVVVAASPGSVVAGIEAPDAASVAPTAAARAFGSVEEAALVVSSAPAFARFCWPCVKRLKAATCHSAASVMSSATDATNTKGHRLVSRPERKYSGTSSGGACGGLPLAPA